ncbi:MAG: hypothetical protein A2Y33_12955 [Spirochaetes bacterium GWF1_51_8]|nr:MAG: hypothetical protein A2Y33_12955 [Spirochaetes bacterium GWF1_51_8]
MRGILLFGFLFLMSCTQEHLLLLKNVQTAQFLSFDQLLKETGYMNYINRPFVFTNQIPLTAKVMTTNQTVLKISQFTNIITNTTPGTLPGMKISTQIVVIPDKNNAIAQSNKITVQLDNKKPPIKDAAPPKDPLTITPIVKNIEMVPGEEFSINVYEKDILLTLKTVEGDIKYLKEKSNPADGFFLFQGGTMTGMVILHGYTKSGKLVKKYIYNIKPLSAQPVQTYPGVTNKIDFAPSDGDITNKGSGFMLSDTVLASLGNLSNPEKIKLLYKNINSGDMTPKDKELLRYQLISYLIDNFSFTEAASNINLLTDQYRKNLYLARMYAKQKKPLEAFKSYYAALNGDPAVIKSAILEMEALYLKEGDIDKSSIDKMKGITAGYIQSDPDFYARSMINLARLMQYVHDIYGSKDIFESILKGNYSKAVMQDAKKYYEELKKNFLEYE